MEMASSPGFGTIDGRKVAVFSQDFTVFGGSLGEAFAEKVVRIMDLAEQYGCPIIGINDSAGARIQEGVEGLAGYGDVFFRNVRASGVVPQISIIAGPCAGGAVYSPAMTDFVIMVDKTSQMFITGPDVIKTVTGEDGDARAAWRRRYPQPGQRRGAFRRRRRGRSQRAGAGAAQLSPIEQSRRRARGSRPATTRSGWSMNSIRLRPETRTNRTTCTTSSAPSLDDGDFLEVQAAFARNIICGFGRLDGYSVGVVANQPQVLAGTLDIDASEKAARFVRFCDAFSIPLVVFEDVPGFLPGPIRNMPASSAMAPSCSTPSAKRPFRG